MEHLLQYMPKEPVEIDYEALPETATLGAHLMAGAFAGIMEHTLIFPIDSIKTRMQIVAPGMPISRSIVRAILVILAQEGARSLWRGVSLVVLGAGPAHAVYFSVFEATRTMMIKKLMALPSSSRIVADENHPLIASMAGIAATTASDALMTPFDVIKQRMQVSLPPSSTTSRSSTSISGSSAIRSSTRFLSTVALIYRHEGIAAFYISYPTTLFTSIPFAALNFGGYEYMLLVLNPSHAYNPYLHCVLGGVAGGLAAAVTTPLDCIKTALQTRGILPNQRLRHATGFRLAAAALAHEGVGAFFRGVKPRIIFHVPSTAISWTAYEMAKEVLLPK